MPKKIVEYRGVSNLVYAEVTKDETGADGYTTGTVKDLAGVATISKTTENSSEAHYYDNRPAVVVRSAGADTVTLDVSVIPHSVLADILGQTYNSTKAMYVEGETTTKYFALGYITKNTDGEDIFVWRLKGTFSVPDETSNTENNGTDANGQQIVFTGIMTAHEFAEGNSAAKAIYVNASENSSVSKATFFATVQTPDTVTAPTP